MSNIIPIQENEKKDAKLIEELGVKNRKMRRVLNRLLSALDKVELSPDTQEVIMPIMADADNLLKKM